MKKIKKYNECENERYLSEAINIADIKRGFINLIKAPCGSGKTTFALDYLPAALKLDKSECIYLTDTANLREQIVLNHINDTQRLAALNEVNKMPISTYCRFGIELSKDAEAFKHLKLIIMDEAHNSVKYSRMDKAESSSGGYCKKALSFIVNNCSSITVIALTATPKLLLYEYSKVINTLSPISPLKQYKTHKTKHYKDLLPLLKTIPIYHKGLIYIQHIKQMEKYIEEANSLGFKAAGFWSANNSRHRMAEEQDLLREYIIKNQEFPKGLDILFINASSETGININTKVDFIIAHTTDEDVIEQVRGRIRNDIDILYTPLSDKSKNMDSDYILHGVVEAYSGIKLFSEEKAALCKALGLRDNKGRLLGWPSVKKILNNSFYEVQDRKTTGGAKRFSVISKKDDYEGI